MRVIAMMAAAGLALGGCSATRDKTAAEAGVVRFHQMLDAGRYHDIYAGSGPEFRRTGSEEEAIRILQMVHDRLGAFRSSNQSGWRVNYGTGGTIVEMTYDARFASAAGTENFVFRINGNAPQLVGYHVNSPELLGPPAPGAAATAGRDAESAAPARAAVVPSAPGKGAEPRPVRGK